MPEISNALGHVFETLRHDLAGRVRTSKDANGVTTEFTYHPRGWLLTRTVKGATVGRLDQQLQRRNGDPRLD